MRPSEPLRPGSYLVQHPAPDPLGNAEPKVLRGHRSRSVRRDPDVRSGKTQDRPDPRPESGPSERTSRTRQSKGRTRSAPGSGSCPCGRRRTGAVRRSFSCRRPRSRTSSSCGSWTCPPGVEGPDSARAPASNDLGSIKKKVEDMSSRFQGFRSDPGSAGHRGRSDVSMAWQPGREGACRAGTSGSGRGQVPPAQCRVSCITWISGVAEVRRPWMRDRLYAVFQRTGGPRYASSDRHRVPPVRSRTPRSASWVSRATSPSG